VVGLVLLIRALDPAVAGHRMTATDRAWRGRGVAHALKVEAIRWAAARGIARLQASNDSGNAPMRAVNDRLGYREDYRLLLLRRRIRG
jgi:RimJ/RimL family protein N-acetyltransferase